MKSLQGQLVWRVLLYMFLVLLPTVFIVSYIIEKKSEDNITSTIEFIRDTKFKSLNKDNLNTAFEFSDLNYTSYIINEKGEMTVKNSYPVDEEIKGLCNTASGPESKKYKVNNLSKYIAIRKNGNLCLVVEANTNNSIMLGQFARNILAGLFVILLLIIFLFLRRSYKKVAKPVKIISENAENAVVSKWGNIRKVETKIEEFQKLDKFSTYLIDLLKQRGGANPEMVNKIIEVKEVEGKYKNEKLERDANKFRLAVDGALDLVAIVDTHGYLTYVNKALTNLTGIKPSDAENKRITDLWHPNDDLNMWKQNFEKVVKEKKPLQFSSWGVKQNGIKFESNIQISPIITDDGFIENLLVVERDVTEEKQKERIKSEFISVVSHELRTPMTVIRGYSTLLTEGKLGDLNEKQKEYIDKINEKTGQLLELANDMLDIQKFESGKIDLKFETTDMNKFVQNIVNDFQTEYSKKGLRLSFENNLKSGSDKANIDLKYFTRVVTNLLTNAYKYTEKGEVKVFLVNPDDNHIVVAVKDTGIGIKEEALQHLFERFYQADGVMQRKQEGTGLGLNIIKTVAEAHNGMVWVESKLGVGSTFYVAIPKA
jgi:PAS domain S-box-containing protein